MYFVSVRRLQQLRQEGILIPEPIKGPRGATQFDYAKNVLNLNKYFTSRAESRSEAKKLTEEKVKQTAAKRALEEIKLARARGELHHTEDIKRIIGSMFNRVHTGLESFPLGIAPLLVDKSNAMEIAGIIKKRLSKVLYEITEFDFATFEKNDGADYIAELEEIEEEENDEPD
jgi:hypothetical protein